MLPLILGSKNFITVLGTAVENGEGVLDKEATSHDDLLDAFGMSLVFREIILL